MQRMNLTSCITRFSVAIAFAVLSALCTGSPALSAEDLVVLPSDVSLVGPEARQILVVEQRREGQFVGQVAADVTFESSDPKVVQIESGVLKPVGNGQAIVWAKVGGARPRRRSASPDSTSPTSGAFAITSNR